MYEVIFERRRIRMKIKENVINELSIRDLIKEADLSDIIIAMPNGLYYNIQTGLYGILKGVIRYGRRYVVIFNYHKCWLAKYIPEHDVVLVVFYMSFDSITGYDEYVSYVKKGDTIPPEMLFKEKCRAIIGRDDFVVFKESERADRHSLYSYNFSTDLCGQYIGDESHGIGLSGLSGEEMRKFAGGPLWDCFGYTVFKNRSHAYALTRCICSSDESDHLGIIEHDMNNIMLGEENPIKNYMGMITEQAKHQISEYINGHSYTWSFIEGIDFGCLQNCNGEYVLRHFVLFIDGSRFANSLTAPIKCVETMRVHITENVINNMRWLQVPLLHFDREGIENGIFKYAVKYLEDAEKNTLSMMAADSIPKTGCDIRLACAVACMPLFEKLLNMFISHGVPKRYDVSNPDSLSMLKDIALCCSGSMETSIINITGDLNPDGKELNQILRIPKNLMKMIAGNPDFFTIIKALKDIFSSDERYFMSIDDNTLHIVIKTLKYNSLICLKKLIGIFGISNISGYCQFLLEPGHADSNNWVQFYSHYLEKIEVIKNASVSGTLQWKLRGEELKKADESITMAYIMLKDRQTNLEVLQKFEQQFDKWAAYEFCDSGFFVTYPKGPGELVEEGLKLNHCVKTFIDRVADGKTTILFIRKAEKPLEQFYTLEIKNNKIRQCHGFCNSNVYEYNGLFEFIKRFAEEKHLEIVNTLDETFGAEEEE